MATGAAELMLRCVFDGSLSISDTEIERRPYHRDCKCALHEMKDKCSQSGLQERSVAFGRRVLSNKCSISVTAASPISPHSSCAHKSLVRHMKPQLESS